MKLGVFVRNMGPESVRSTLETCVKSAEEAGFDSAFVFDHLALPPDQTEGSGGRYLDALITLGVLAGATQTIRLGVGVLILPYRPAVLTAKQIATLQELSGNRIILGAGVGWLRPEFHALGVDPRKRGALANETLAVIRQLFDNDISSFTGDHFEFPEFVFSPRPPCPPIWVGGTADAALERALKYADGYFPLGDFGPEDADRTRRYFKQESAKRNRTPPRIITGGALDDDPNAALAHLKALGENGVDHYIVSFGSYADADGFQRKLEQFHTGVMSRL